MTDNKHRAKKRLGQNFLTDGHYIDKIITAIKPKLDDDLLEIGPGQGAITDRVLALALNRPLQVIEIDDDLIPTLQARGDNLIVHHLDALEADLSQLATGQKLRVFGNLPYNISTPLLFHCQRYHDVIQDMHFMLQKEVVMRMVAAPGSKVYGRLSVMSQYYFDITVLFHLPPNAFSPPPKVHSTFFRLIPRSHRDISAIDETILAKVVSLAFGQRRKTLNNSLKALVTKDMWQQCGIAPTRRPEQLTLAEFIELSDIVSTNGQ